jgi:ring-1,2-phenylacetyl-CoA epoxidase subunit PaaC
MPNTNFAYIMARQFFIDTFNFYLYTALLESSDPTLAGIAEKALKEVKYHIRRSSEWVVRLGDGTDESHSKMQEAIDDLWMYSGELFEMDETDHELAGKNIAPDLNVIKRQWNDRVNSVLELAKLNRPENEYFVTGSRQGIHTEHLGHVLTEMQYLNRAYPEAKW